MIKDRLYIAGFSTFKNQITDMENKVVVILGLSAFVFFGIAASNPSMKKERNLKVLPKDITDTDLDSVMNGFARGLNVSCDFCHTSSKINKDDIDFSSDDKPEKDIARIMMKMTASINKDFFDYTIVYKAGELMAVSCYTCHDGFPRPELKHEKKE